MWYTYIIEYCSAIKRTEIMLNKDMGGPRDCHTEWSKSERERQIPVISLIYRIEKKWYKWTYL